MLRGKKRSSSSSIQVRLWRVPCFGGWFDCVDNSGQPAVRQLVGRLTADLAKAADEYIAHVMSIDPALRANLMKGYVVLSLASAYAPNKLA